MLCKHTVTARDAIIRCTAACASVSRSAQALVHSFVANSELRTTRNWFAVSFPPKTVNYAERFRLNVICFRWCTDWLLECTSIFAVHLHQTNTKPNNIIKMWTCISEPQAVIVYLVAMWHREERKHYYVATFEFSMMIFCSRLLRECVSVK